AKSWSLYFLVEFEFREEYTEKALETISEAFLKSSEVGNTLLMFETIYMKIWSLSKNYKHEEVLENIEIAEEIYGKLKAEYPDLSKEKKVFLLSLYDLGLIHKEYIVENYKWDFQESIGYLEEALQLNADSSEKGTVLNKILTLILYRQISLSHTRISEYSKEVEYRKKALKIAEENKNEYWMSFILQLIGRAYWVKGEYNLYLEYTYKAREISEKQGNIRGIGSSHHNFGIYYGEIGEWKKCLEHSQKAYDILSEDGKREGSNIIAQLINNIAACNYSIGDFDKALALYDKGIEISKKTGHEELVLINLGNKAIVHKEIGELDVALKIHEERLEYFERRGFKKLLCNALWNIASIYQAKGLFNKAHEHFKEALQIHDDLGNKSRGVFTLYSLVLLGVEFDKIELAKEYYQELERRSEDVEYKITKNQVLQAEAAILARSSVARDRIRAEVIYEQLLNEQLHYTVYLGIIFHLCELLLSELKASSDERILAKLQKYVTKMIELSTKNYFTLLIVESLWFKAQLSLLNLDFEKTKELLTQAQSIAEEKGLNRLTLKIMKAKEQLVQQLVDLEDLEKESPTISKRMDTIKIEKGFKEITSSQMYQFKQNI
ncbi:MAG: tetratricopeptide repeat protein, partial [Candidatus Heimdallarchaeaceae archaeon]